MRLAERLAIALAVALVGACNTAWPTLAPRSGEPFAPTGSSAPGGRGGDAVLHAVMRATRRRTGTRRAVEIGIGCIVARPGRAHAVRRRKAQNEAPWSSAPRTASDRSDFPMRAQS